jgi:uncharacterized RDD family membrane protein YckC
VISNDPYAPYAPSVRPPYPPPYPATAWPSAGAGWGGMPRYAYVPELASWRRRLAAFLIDLAFMVVPFLPPYVFALVTAEYGTSATGSSTSSFTPAGAVAIIVAFLWVFGSWIWNRIVRQGRTGQSLGKKALGIRLVGARTLLAPGAALTFARELAHKLDEVLYLGYLWPLWDEQRRTFADMIVSTLVVRERP